MDNALMNAADLRAQLVGAWRLVSYETRSIATGTVGHPLCENARGLLLYTADGYMSAQIMAADPPPFVKADLHQADRNDLAAAARGYIAYSGPFEVSADGRLTHHMTVSLFPNWLGQTQERIVSLDGRRLQLATADPVVVRGEESAITLVWERT